MDTDKVLGVDIGGVITKGGNEIFTDAFLESPQMGGAFEAVRMLVANRFGNNVYLVSKCGENMQKKTRLWLSHHRFYEVTGIPESHVRFCLERHQKASICEELGITHFVDDRLEVLGSLTTVSNLYLFQPRPNEMRRFAHFLNRVRQVNAWEEILRELLTS